MEWSWFHPHTGNVHSYGTISQGWTPLPQSLTLKSITKTFLIPRVVYIYLQNTAFPTCIESMSKLLGSWTGVQVFSPLKVFEPCMITYFARPVMPVGRMWIKLCADTYCGPASNKHQCGKGGETELDNNYIFWTIWWHQTRILNYTSRILQKIFSQRTGI